MLRIALLLLGLLGVSASAQQGIAPCAATSISVSNTTANAQLSSCGQTAILWNVGSQELFYALGPLSSQAATTSNFSLPGNSFVIINVGLNKPYLAAITSTSTTTLRITQGQVP